ncbi:MAG: hypothetical protein H6713_20530 [Myxococcales bacterium]|nr:hypothetical protein [Myxococcales bacterium]
MNQTRGAYSSRRSWRGSGSIGPPVVSFVVSVSDSSVPALVASVLVEPVELVIPPVPAVVSVPGLVPGPAVPSVAEAPDVLDGSVCAAPLSSPVVESPGPESPQAGVSASGIDSVSAVNDIRGCLDIMCPYGHMKTRAVRAC